jgi:hypothetical protein
MNRKGAEVAEGARRWFEGWREEFFHRRKQRKQRGVIEGIIKRAIGGEH